MSGRWAAIWSPERSDRQAQAALHRHRRQFTPRPNHPAADAIVAMDLATGKVK